MLALGQVLPDQLPVEVVLVEQQVQAEQLGRLRQQLPPHQAHPELVAVSCVADAEARDGPAGLVVQIAHADDHGAVLDEVVVEELVADDIALVLGIHNIVYRGQRENMSRCVPKKFPKYVWTVP